MRTRWWRAGLGATCGLLVLWAAGFVWFAIHTAALAPTNADAGGIVVLTGGPGRVEAGLQLLHQGRADRLLISGVTPGTTLAMVAHAAGTRKSAITRHVTLGYRALTTRGNAEEAARWVARHDVRRLIVVTSSYHMPRALIEFTRAMPHITLLPWPVMPNTRHGRGWRLLAMEYSKWLAAQIGVSELEPSQRRLRPEAAFTKKYRGPEAASTKKHQGPEAASTKKHRAPEAASTKQHQGPEAASAMDREPETTSATQPKSAVVPATSPPTVRSTAHPESDAASPTSSRPADASPLPEAATSPPARRDDSQPPRKPLQNQQAASRSAGFTPSTDLVKSAGLVQSAAT